MNLKFKMTKKQMVISGLSVASVLAIGTYSYLATNREEVVVAKEEVIELSKSTVESTIESSEVEEVIEKVSLISKTSEFTYDKIFYQNGLLVADRSGDVDVFDGNLNMLDTIYSFDESSDALAKTHNRENHINGTAVILNDKDAIFATYINQNGALDKTSIGMTESQTNGRRLMTQVANKYNVFAQTEFNESGNFAYAHLNANEYHEKNYNTANGTSVSDVNKDGYFTVIKDASNKYGDSFVYIYDAGLRNKTEDSELETKKIETIRLATASNLNDKNQLVMQQYATGLSGDPLIWSFYDLNTDTSFNFPENVEIVRFYNWGLNEATDGSLGEIGMADNLIYSDKSDGLQSNENTPSNTDYVPLKQGIISKDGRVIKEPFAQQILKPNGHGIAPYQLETEGQFGLININTGEVIKEPYADFMNPFNENGLSTMMINSKVSIINEQGEILEETDYAYISTLTDDNTASYRAYKNDDLGIVKINVE